MYLYFVLCCMRFGICNQCRTRDVYLDSNGVCRPCNNKTDTDPPEGNWKVIYGDAIRSRVVRENVSEDYAKRTADEAVGLKAVQMDS